MEQVPSTGKRFGRYELRERIGVGGMAWVFRAWDTVLEREVAIKILFPQFAEDPTIAARFEVEARSAARMQHDNIVHIHDMGDVDGVPFIDMELLHGCDLRTWMQRQGGAPPLEIAMLMLRDICRGVEHAHATGPGIVHRDIKPANVMFTRAGLIKIMDFGLARLLDDTSGRTSAGLVLGTWAYMSPEQSAGVVSANVEDLKLSDVFSTGTLAFELLGGELPFKGEGPSEVVRAIQMKEPPDLSSLNPLVPPSVERLVRHMLQKRTSDRCPSLSHAAEVLDDAIEGLLIRRERALMREYAADPARVRRELAARALERHRERAAVLEAQAPVDRVALARELHCVLHLEPGDAPAGRRLRELESGADQPTVVLPAAGTVMDADPAPRPPAVPPPAPAPRPEPAPTVLGLPRSPGPAALGPRPSRPRRARVLATLAAIAVLVVALVVIARMWPPAPRTAVVPPPPDTSGVVEPESTTVPPATTRLAVTTDPPGARVLMDGATVAVPAGAKWADVPAGSRVVRVEAQGFVAQERRVELVAGLERTLEFVLLPEPGPDGALEIEARPYAAVYVDGALVDSNRVSIRIPLRPGRYRVRLEHPLFPRREWTDVLVRSARATLRRHDFEAVASAQVGRLVVACEGGWGDIWLDGKDIGVTAPGVVRDLPRGVYEVRVVNRSLEIEGGAKQVAIQPGQTTTVTFRARAR